MDPDGSEGGQPQAGGRFGMELMRHRLRSVTKEHWVRVRADGRWASTTTHTIAAAERGASHTRQATTTINIALPFFPFLKGQTLGVPIFEKNKRKRGLLKNVPRMI